MPPPQSKPAPDFIPAEQPDFIPLGADQAGFQHFQGRPHVGSSLNGDAPWQQAIDKAAETEPESAEHPVRSTLNNLGAGAVRSTLQPLAHPISTVGNLLKTGAGFLINPAETGQKMVEGIMQNPSGEAVAAIPQAIMAGFGAPEAAEDAGSIFAKIPSRARAGTNFQKAMAVAGNEPVLMERSMPNLQRTQELASRGANPVRVADQLFERTRNVANADTGEIANPLTYREARDFASNIGQRSFMDRMGTSPTMSRELKFLNRNFNQDIGDAAERAGVGDVHNAAMKEYAQAQRLRNILKYGVGVPAAGYALSKTGILGKVVKGAAAAQ